MKTLISCLLVVTPVCLLMSCSGEKKPPEEEKIHIIVQHEKSEGRDRPRARSSVSPAPDTDSTKIEPDPSLPDQAPADSSNIGVASQPNRMPDDDIIKIPGARDMIRNMIRDDDQLKELVTQGNVLPLAEYLLDHHETELDKIAQKSDIKNKRRIAFILSRMMTQRNQQLREKTGQ